MCVPAGGQVAFSPPARRACGVALEVGLLSPDRGLQRGAAFGAGLTPRQAISSPELAGVSGAAGAPSRTARSETASCSMRSRCVLNSAGVSGALRDNA